ncbi:MAG: UDP-3-O-acyl-N-acetylglucosamine deacetylase [Rhodospirillales bacterium]|nr:UDP-3-O-acyl-N-acetylglucosamine deacetylase [Rhodospirillales bacterium]
MDGYDLLPANHRFLRQRTLKAPIDCTGVALHSGDTVTMTINPGDANTGIVFRRTDVSGRGAEIAALWNNVVDTRLCTVLGNSDGVTVSTVEHIMAALAGCGIDNAVIELNGPEVPIMDGSSEPFVFLLECAGVVEQDADRRVVRGLKTISATDGECTVSIQPASRFEVDMEINFETNAISHQNIRLGVVNGSFSKELARARTFGFLHEVEAMRAAGLAKGGSLENAIVVSGDEILNEDGLRFDDEFVRHKALDAVGDMYLAGGQIIGAFSGVRSGHALNNQLLRALFADESAWTYDVIAADEADNMPNGGIDADRSEFAIAANA